MSNTKVRRKGGNPYLPGGNECHGRLSERRVARVLGARQTPASGALCGAKGDATLECKDYRFRIESKATANKSLGVKYEWLEKITKEALETNRLPALTVSFVTPGGVECSNGDWVMIPRYLFQEVFVKEA